MLPEKLLKIAVHKIKASICSKNLEKVEQLFRLTKWLWTGLYHHNNNKRKGVRKRGRQLSIIVPVIKPLPGGELSWIEKAWPTVDFWLLFTIVASINQRKVLLLFYIVYVIVLVVASNRVQKISFHFGELFATSHTTIWTVLYKFIFTVLMTKLLYVYKQHKLSPEFYSCLQQDCTLYVLTPFFPIQVAQHTRQIDVWHSQKCAAF